ncbi:hypothetical protein C8Q80DRAFT_1062335, partial [Daedaleopsis nitida]
VPMEVVEHIIHYLWDDHLALRQCSLTCQGWLLRSRFHLFKEVEIATLLQLDSLRRVFASTPVCRSFVQVVELYCSLAKLSNCPEPRWEHISSDIFTSAPVVLLSDLPNIREWRFHVSPMDLRTPCYLSPASMAALRQYTATRTLELKTLRISSTVALARILLALPELRDL